MLRKKFINWVLLGISILFIDFVLYIVFGLIILNYEDFYDESKGEYWSLASMTTIEKIGYIGYYALIIINIIAVAYLIYKFFKKF